MAGESGVLLGFFLWAIVIVIYFIPSFIANDKKKKNTGAIFALNLLTGWTVIGWIIALVWALTHDK